MKKSELESGPQERNRLLEQVKNDNLETGGMDRKISEMEAAIKSLKELIGISEEVDPDLVEKQGKYDELVKKDGEMQEFLDVFEERRVEMERQSLAAEVEITEILAKIQVNI